MADESLAFFPFSEASIIQTAIQNITVSVQCCQLYTYAHASSAYAYVHAQETTGKSRPLTNQSKSKKNTVTLT